MRCYVSELSVAITGHTLTQWKSAVMALYWERRHLGFRRAERRHLGFNWLVKLPFKGAHCYFNLRKHDTCTISHHTSEVCCKEVAVKWAANVYFEDFLGWPDGWKKLHYTSRIYQAWQVISASCFHTLKFMFLLILILTVWNGETHKDHHYCSSQWFSVFCNAYFKLPNAFWRGSFGFDHLWLLQEVVSQASLQKSTQKSSGLCADFPADHGGKLCPLLAQRQQFPNAVDKWLDRGLALLQKWY